MKQGYESKSSNLKAKSTSRVNMSEKKFPRSHNRPPWIQKQLDQGYKPCSFFVTYHRTTPTPPPPPRKSTTPATPRPSQMVRDRTHPSSTSTVTATTTDRTSPLPTLPLSTVTKATTKRAGGHTPNSTGTSPQRPTLSTARSSIKQSSSQTPGFPRTSTVGTSQAEKTANGFASSSAGSSSAGVPHRPEDRASTGLDGLSTVSIASDFTAMAGGGYRGEDSEGASHTEVTSIVDLQTDGGTDQDMDPLFLLRTGNQNPLAAGNNGLSETLSTPSVNGLPNAGPTSTTDIDLATVTMQSEKNSKGIDREEVLPDERDSLSRQNNDGHSETENNLTTWSVPDESASDAGDSRREVEKTTQTTQNSSNFNSSVLPLIEQTTANLQRTFQPAVQVMSEASTAYKTLVEQPTESEGTTEAVTIAQTSSNFGDTTPSEHSNTVADVTKTMEVQSKVEQTSSVYGNVTKLQIPVTVSLTDDPHVQQFETVMEHEMTTDKGQDEHDLDTFTEPTLADNGSPQNVTLGADNGSSTINRVQNVTVSAQSVPKIPVEGIPKDTEGITVKPTSTPENTPQVAPTRTTPVPILPSSTIPVPSPSVSSQGTTDEKPASSSFKKTKTRPPCYLPSTSPVTPTTKRKRNRKRTRPRKQRTTSQPRTLPVGHEGASTLRYPLNLLASQSNRPVAYSTIHHTTPPGGHVVLRNSTYGVHTLSSGEVTGIAVGCIVAFWIILGPLVCFICRMRDKAHEKHRERQQEDSLSHTLIEEMIRLELARGRAKMYRTNVDDEREIERLPLQGCDWHPANGCPINPQDYVIGNRYMEYTKIENPPDIKQDYHKEYILNKTYVDTLDIKKQYKVDTCSRDTNV